MHSIKGQGIDIRPEPAKPALFKKCDQLIDSPVKMTRKVFAGNSDRLRDKTVQILNSG